MNASSINFSDYSDADLVSLLRRRGITPTPQRLLILRTLFAKNKHLAADDLFQLTRDCTPNVSKATVYNTLGLLAEKGVIRAVIADPNRMFYDPNTAPHHHLYDEVSGELTDIDAEEVSVTGLPSLPDNVQLQGIDVIIRIRSSTRG